MTKRKWDGYPKILEDSSSPKPKKMPEKSFNQPGSSNEPSFHVLQMIAAKIGSAPDFLKFSAVNSQCKTVVDKEITKHRQGLVVDTSECHPVKKILPSTWYTSENANEFHNCVRETVRLLAAFVEVIPSNNNILVNFTPYSLGWQYPNTEEEIKRCPLLLQQKIVKLVKEHFNKTTEFVYHKSFLRPSRFVQMFRHRLEDITVLDLGDMKALSAVGLRRKIFPGLSNLKELVWHSAETWFIEALPHPHKLKSLCITLNIKGSREDLLRLLLNCQGLERLHTGIHRPPKNRFVWTVVLQSYQAFWNQRQYVPGDILQNKGIVPVPIAEGKESDFTYRAFPALEKISFWDTPEYLFVTMAKERISYKEVQLGLLSQDLQSLCSLDSVTQAFFKYMQPENVNPIFIDHLKIHTHSMPAVTLSYYLPKLMDALGTTLPSLQTLDLFVHCLIPGTSMNSSWSQKNKAKPKFENLLKFSFHIDGYCLVDGLDTYLPPSVQSVSLSFIQPREHRRKFLASLLKFIQLLGDINRFPDLDELHIQVWGLACFESVVNAVVDHLPSLKRLSVISLPASKDMSQIKELIGHVVKSSPHLVEFGLSSELIAFLLSEEEKKSHWRDILFNLGESCGITNECTLSTRKLPETEGWDRYTVQPIHATVEELSDDEEDMSTDGEKDKISDEEEEEEDEEDSFVVHSDEVSEESEDELDAAERALEQEDERSHRKWQKKRARIVSESSEKSEDNEDVVVFRRRRPGQIITSDDEEMEDDDEEEDEERNPFVDDEAEEGSDESDEDETEPEGEDLAQSDDDRLFEEQSERINRPNRRAYPPRKSKRICESDSD